MPEELNERERLIKEFEKYVVGVYNASKPLSFDNPIRWQMSRIPESWHEMCVNYILADRKKVLEQVRKPLEKVQPVAKIFGRYDDLWNAQCEALSKIKELMGS